MSPLQYLKKAGEFSTHFAGICLAIGTILLILQQFVCDEHGIILSIGLLYVIVAFVLNTILFGYLVFYFVAHPAYRKYFAVKMLLMLANIPIAIFYIHLVFKH